MVIFYSMVLSKKLEKLSAKTPLKLLFLSKVADRYARQMNATTDEFLVNV